MFIYLKIVKQLNAEFKKNFKKSVDFIFLICYIRGAICKKSKKV